MTRRLTRHWAVVAGATCLMTAGQFIFLSASILNPPLARSLGVGLSEVMLFNSLMAVSGVFAMTFLGPVAYRTVGVRASIIAGGLWLAAAMAAVAFVPNLAVLYALGFAAGLTLGIATSMASSMLVNTWFEERRGTVMGAVFAVSGLGGVAAGLVLPALVNAGGWQQGFLFISGVVLVLVVLPGVFLIRSSPADVGLRPYGAHEDAAAPGSVDVHLPGVPARIAFRSRQFVALAVSIILFASVQALMQHFAPAMVERGVNLTVAGSLISLMAMASVFSNIALGTLNDRRGTLAAVLVALGCQILALIGYVFSVGFWPLAVNTALFAVGSAFPGVLVPILVLQLFGMRDYARILGPSMAMLPAGVSIGTPLWGLAYDTTGSYTAALVASVVVLLVASLLLVWTIRSGPAFRSRVERELGQA